MRVHMDKKNNVLVVVFRTADECQKVGVDLVVASRNLASQTPIAYALKLDGCELTDDQLTALAERVINARSEHEGGHLDQPLGEGSFT